MFLFFDFDFFLSQVHFPGGSLVPDSDVNLLAADINKGLDELQTDVKGQNATLEACLTQLDQYQVVSTAVILSRPTFSQLWSFKIRRTTFLGYIK